MPPALQCLALTFAGWVNRHQQVTGIATPDTILRW